ncbi:MAG: fatty acid oxidation complex subunit alpha FadB [Deltaproteobacteria bacterium]|nr:fatty acid oxidation complex subunit alpha FadB [Deltaproteobacteria bacterium]
MKFEGKAIKCSMKDAKSGIAELCFDLQGESVNKFNQLTMGELDQAVEQLSQATEVKGLLITSAKEAFIVGADPNEFLPAFQMPENELAQWLSKAQGIFSRLEDLPFPSVAALNGYTLGGGMELAMAATYRVMSEGAKLGQPEVKLGIIPGFGGTVRMPRLIGPDNAIDLIASGRDVRASEALKLGLVSTVVSPDKLEAAGLALLKKTIADESWKKVVAEKKEPLKLNGVERTMSFTLAKALVGEKAGPNYPAPVEAVKVMEKAAGDTRDKAMAKEAQSFAKMAKTPQAAMLITIFHGDQFLKKKAKSIVKDSQKIKAAGVLGAGIMGGGIAYQSSSRGVAMVMKDINHEAIGAGLGEAARLFGKQVQRGRLTPEEAAGGLTRIQGVLSYGDLRFADVVVEAVPENLKIKHQVLIEAEQAMEENAVLASNTSTIPITRLAEVLKRPENFCGMHFFNPVHMMPLVEVIRYEKTSAEALARVVAYAQQMGKIPIVVQDGPGFLVNRILIPYMMTFQQLVKEGVSVEAVDKAMKKFGWPMGPAELSDVVGLDTSHHIGVVMAEALPDTIKLIDNAPSTLLFNAGRLGQKNGKGYYSWEIDKRGKHKKTFDPEVMDVLKPGLEGGPREMSQEELEERLLLPMIIEASRCLEQGIVESPIEVDMGTILGIGFPPFRGGLLRYADSVGVAKLVEAADRHKAHGPLYEPTRQMKELAGKGQGFHPPLA